MPIRNKRKKRKPSKTVGAPASIGNASEYLKTLRGDLAHILRTSDESLREKLGSVYLAARVLSLNIDQWQTFCGQEEWRTYRRPPKATKDGMAEALRHAVRFAVGFEGVTSDRAVYRYTAALKQCWDQDLPFDQVPKAIEDAGGIEKMKRNQARQSASIGFQLEGKAFAKKLKAFGDSPAALLFIRFRNETGGSRIGEIITGLLQKEDELPEEIFEALRNLAIGTRGRRPL